VRMLFLIIFVANVYKFIFTVYINIQNNFRLYFLRSNKESALLIICYQLFSNILFI